jgi:hypothetical protein
LSKTKLLARDSCLLARDTCLLCAQVPVQTRDATIEFRLLLLTPLLVLKAAWDVPKACV